MLFWRKGVTTYSGSSTTEKSLRNLLYLQSDSHLSTSARRVRWQCHTYPNSSLTLLLKITFLNLSFDFFLPFFDWLVKKKHRVVISCVRVTLLSYYFWGKFLRADNNSHIVSRQTWEISILSFLSCFIFVLSHTFITRFGFDFPLVACRSCLLNFVPMYL